ADERTVQHDVDDRSPSVRAQFGGGHGEVAGSVVHEDADRTERLLHRVERRGHRLRLPHVDRDTDSASTHRLDGRHPARAMALVAARDRDRGAEPRELDPHRLAEAGAAAGHQHDLAVERAGRTHRGASRWRFGKSPGCACRPVRVDGQRLALRARPYLHTGAWPTTLPTPYCSRSTVPSRPSRSTGPTA